MCLFIESIALKEGVLQNLEGHQERIDRTLSAFDTNKSLSLTQYLLYFKFPPTGYFKIKITYSTKAFLSIETTPYIYKEIQSIQLIEDSFVDYPFKYEDRSSLNQLKSQSTCDEILIVKEGYISDASIYNIVFWNGKDWYTPEHPLLLGTQLNLLLKNQWVQKRPITPTDLPLYHSFKLINALNPFELAKEYPVEIIKFQH